MARAHRYATTQVAKEVGVHRNTVTRWANGERPAGFPLGPLRTTPTGKLLLQPSDVTALRAWALATGAGNRGVVRAVVLAMGKATSEKAEQKAARQTRERRTKEREDSEAARRRAMGRGRPRHASATAETAAHVEVQGLPSVRAMLAAVLPEVGQPASVIAALARLTSLNPTDRERCERDLARMYRERRP